MTDETNEAKALIRALRDGSMSLEEVAHRFRGRTWPSTTPPPPDSYLEMARRALEDPRPDVADSYDDVVAAYGRGELTREQFDVLSQAVADANNAQ
jgi:hypothetical protein